MLTIIVTAYPPKQEQEWTFRPRLPSFTGVHLLRSVYTAPPSGSSDYAAVIPGTSLLTTCKNSMFQGCCHKENTEPEHLLIFGSGEGVNNIRQLGTGDNFLKTVDNFEANLIFKNCLREILEQRLSMWEQQFISMNRKTQLNGLLKLGWTMALRNYNSWRGFNTRLTPFRRAKKLGANFDEMLRTGKPRLLCLRIHRHILKWIFL